MDSPYSFPEQLWQDVLQAYKDARRHKRYKPYQLQFEFELEQNLLQLCEDLHLRRYKAQPSTCFIIHEPKMREVFAADFRDRVVHHLFYNYTHQYFERTFIEDSYSCIKGKGTHYGIKRLKHHILSCSQNYTRDCYVLKMDIRGYFMHINRARLLELATATLRKYRHQIASYDLVMYLLLEIVLLNPVQGCKVVGDKSEWEALPADKSLFHSSAGCGLPIGNLTSQLFSNVYLNVLDQFCKRVLGCKHYGRYVDDLYIVSSDKAWLRQLMPRIQYFMQEELGLSLQTNKVLMLNVRQGVPFLGAFIKPYRTYVDNHSLRRIKNKLHTARGHLSFAQQASFRGVLSHYSSYHWVRRLLDEY